MTSAVSDALGDLLVRPGSQVRGNCLVSLGMRTVSLPVAITHGSASGPVLAVTAGIHGAEYVPIVAVRQFIRDLDPTQMRGTIVACLQSSPVAFQERSALVNPLDGQNLNEIGLKNGNLVVDDQQRGNKWTFDNISLSLRRPSAGGP